MGEDTFRIEATIESPLEERRVAAAYQRSTRRKRVEVDGAEVERLSEAIGTLGVVAFSLADVELVSGPPAVRRRFLDILLSLVRPGYLESLRRCGAIVAQRNEVLRSGAGSSELASWTESLAKAGAPVMEARSRWVAERADAFFRYHRAIAGGVGAQLAYRPSIGANEPAVADAADGPADDRDLALWETRFRAALERAEERERAHGMTLVGPHRDDVALRAPVADEAERPIRRFGSGGQQRTAALALRLLEADTLRDRSGVEPVYLLDDVFAELDRERSEGFLCLLEEGRSGQVILTTPKPADVRLRGGLAEWKIQSGRLET